MYPSLRLRNLKADDLPFADSLRAANGWNQTLIDWERMLALEPHGCFLAEWDEVPVGTATTTIYDASLAWIGMVLVHADYRRRGIGQKLLKGCLDYLHSRGVQCIKLDATPLGMPVYEGLGFQREWTLTRWEAGGIETAVPRGDNTLRKLEAADLPQLAMLDEQAFGVARSRLLSSLHSHATTTLVKTDSAGKILGYGFLRPGARAFYLGPVTATTAEVGVELVRGILRSAALRPIAKIFWDIPDQNAPAIAVAQEYGFTQQRSLTRMFLGTNTKFSDPYRQFAITAPELG